MDEKRPALDALGDMDFSGRVGETFRLRLPSGEAQDLTLLEVHTHRYAPPGQTRRGFSITFRSALPGHVPQGIYAVSHDQMGTMELFLVPVGPRDGGMCYEAVFN
jgi:hypothetical protein